MENFDNPLPENIPAQRIESNEEIPESAGETIVYPPKFEKPEQTTNIWLKSLFSLALFLFLGYYIFHSFKMLLLITAIVMFHELGHFFAMKFFRYKDLGIFFIPLLGAYVSGTKREVSQKESAIILLAGPLPGIIVGIIMYILYEKNPELSVAGISFHTISSLLIALNLINLIPVYPLDGGQLLNRVFLDEESRVSKIFVFLSAGLLCWVALFAMKHPFYPLLLFPAMLLFHFFVDLKLKSVEKRIETEGHDMDKSYEELTDKDYWAIRNVLIMEHPAFKEIPLPPPYEYDVKEEKIMATIKSLLHRHLLQDISVAGKIFLLIIWAAAIASPWLLKMDIYFLN
jgi:stage IV sporulation protein FB